MGTNYYVHTGPCETPCAHCKAPEAIHLGKSSGGWSFTFRAYPVWDGADRSEIGPVVSDYASWLKLLDLGEIRDEYDRAVSRDELLSLIEGKRDGLSTLYGHDFIDSAGHRFCSSDFC